MISCYHMNTPSSSGRILLRVPPSLHRTLRGRAKAAGTSMNRFCHAVLKAAVDDDGFPVASGTVVGAHGRSLWHAMAAAVVRELGDELEAVAVFGSRARGHAGPGSDVDLLLALSDGATLDRKRYAEWDRTLAVAAEIKALGAQVNPHFARLPTGRPGTDDGGSSLWLEVALHGIVLWQRTSSLSQWTGDAREMMAAGVLRRRLAHGQPYWLRSGGRGHE